MEDRQVAADSREDYGVWTCCGQYGSGEPRVGCRRSPAHRAKLSVLVMHASDDWVEARGVEKVLQEQNQQFDVSLRSINSGTLHPDFDVVAVIAGPADTTRSMAIVDEYATGGGEDCLIVLAPNSSGSAVQISSQDIAGQAIKAAFKNSCAVHSPSSSPRWFLSYSRLDQQWSDDVMRAFWGAWRDKEYLSAGVVWERSLQDALQSAGGFLFAARGDVRLDGYAWRELKTALSHKIPTVVICEGNPPRDLEVLLGKFDRWRKAAFADELERYGRGVTSKNHDGKVLVGRSKWGGGPVCIFGNLGCDAEVLKDCNEWISDFVPRGRVDRLSWRERLSRGMRSRSRTLGLI